MCSSSCWACYAWFGVYFIIEAPIRGKPSCARPRGPKASHQRKLLTAVKFWISDFWGANWYLYCPLGPVPRLTSSPQPRWRICQITLLGDMSAAGLRWWLGAELSVTEFGNGTTDPLPFHRSRCSGNRKGGGSSVQFNYERIPRRRQRGWWRGPPHNGHTPESRKLGHRSWRAGAKIPGAARRSPGRSPSRRPSLHLDPSRAVSTCAAVISHNTLALLQTGSCRPLWRSVCDVGSRKRHRLARQ